MSHPKTMRIKPAAGITLHDPDSGEILPPEGGTVPRSGFWIRRLRDGDVIEISSPAKAAAKGE